MKKQVVDLKQLELDEGISVMAETIEAGADLWTDRLAIGEKPGRKIPGPQPVRKPRRD